MIGYRVSRQELETLIEAEKAGWLARAAARTEGFRAAGRYDETSCIWSEVKPVYMRLQGGSKCAFCERKLESATHGKVEQDVEHFRPKGRVTHWRLSAKLRAAGVTLTPLPATAPGYHLLPYDLFNYTAACKPCNSTLKADRFPIAGPHDFGGDRPETLMATEQPLLIYPLGDFDDDPESLIEFHGVSPMAKAASAGLPRWRALVTIEFFGFDDVTGRKNLLEERARLLVALFPQLQIASGAQPGGQARANRLIRAFQADTAPHANCVRAFVRLHGRDATKAQSLFDDAVDLIEGSS